MNLIFYNIKIKFSVKKNINIDLLNIIKYYNINEHKQNGVDEEEYILT